MFCHAQPLEIRPPDVPRRLRGAFPDEASCARQIAAKRCPTASSAPSAADARGWGLKRRRSSWECTACGKETSVTAGTIMHRSHLPLKTWFMAVHIVTSHSSGISALQLQAQLGRQLQECLAPATDKLRRAMTIRIAACLRTWSRG